MRSHLHDLPERGAEPLAALWASEALIYGRFGYKLAASGSSLKVILARTAYRPGIDTGADTVEVLDNRTRLRSSHQASRG